MTTKKVFGASDAHPTVLHAKQNADSEIAYPLIVSSDGNLLVASGLVPKNYDYISLSPASQPTTIEYRTGGSSGTLVATLVLTYSGTDVASISRV